MCGRRHWQEKVSSCAIDQPQPLWQAVPAAHTTVVVAMCIVIVKMACEKFPLCAEFVCV